MFFFFFLSRPTSTQYTAGPAYRSSAIREAAPFRCARSSRPEYRLSQQGDLSAVAHAPTFPAAPPGAATRGSWRSANESKPARHSELSQHRKLSLERLVVVCSRRASQKSENESVRGSCTSHWTRNVLPLQDKQIARIKWRRSRLDALNLSFPHYSPRRKNGID